jgi:hypothetical protein
MKALAGIFLGIHILAVAGIVLLLLKQAGKAVKVLPKGLTHLGLTAGIAGIVMVGIRQAQHHQDAHLYPLYNYGTLAIKFLVLSVLLTLAFKYSKSAFITRNTWMILLALTVLNIGLAGSLK